MILAILAAMALTSSTCSSDNNEFGPDTGGNSRDSWHSLVNEQQGTLQVDGNRAAWGSHTYEFADAGSRKTVTFSNIPSGYTEFSALYYQWCGDNPYMTAAMMVWAMEIYARDAATGERCITLINQPSNVPGVVRELKQKFTHSQYAPANDTYVQRYLPAAHLAGATPRSGYKPAEPYTITLADNATQAEEGVPEVCIISEAYSTPMRNVRLLLPSHQLNTTSRVLVFSCPSLYSQCPVFTGTWAGLR